jgi:hypothetical protein
LTSTTSTTMDRYISSGMWRDVWSLTPRHPPPNNNNSNNDERVVLKMMKQGTCVRYGTRDIVFICEDGWVY